MEEVKNAIHQALKNLWNIEVDVVLSRPDKQGGINFRSGTCFAPGAGQLPNKFKTVAAIQTESAATW